MPAATVIPAPRLIPCRMSSSGFSPKKSSGAKCMGRQWRPETAGTTASMATAYNAAFNSLILSRLCYSGLFLLIVIGTAGRSATIRVGSFFLPHKDSANPEKII